MIVKLSDKNIIVYRYVELDKLVREKEIVLIKIKEGYIERE